MQLGLPVYLIYRDVRHFEPLVCTALPQLGTRPVVKAVCEGAPRVDLVEQRGAPPNLAMALIRLHIAKLMDIPWRWQLCFTNVKECSGMTVVPKLHLTNFVASASSYLSNLRSQQSLLSLRRSRRMLLPGTGGYRLRACRTSICKSRKRADSQQCPTRVAFPTRRGPTRVKS